MEVNQGAHDGNTDGSGDEAGTGRTGTGVETRGRTQDGIGDRSGDGDGSSSGDGNGDEDGNGTGTRIGPARAEARRRSATNHTKVVDAMWETGETWVERGENVNEKGLVQQLPTQII